MFCFFLEIEATGEELRAGSTAAGEEAESRRGRERRSGRAWRALTYLRRGRCVGVVEDDDGAGGDDDGDLADARQRVEEPLDERDLGGAADPQHVEVALLDLAAGRRRRRRLRRCVPHPLLRCHAVAPTNSVVDRNAFICRRRRRSREDTPHLQVAARAGRQGMKARGE